MSQPVPPQYGPPQQYGHGYPQPPQQYGAPAQYPQQYGAPPQQGQGYPQQYPPQQGYPAAANPGMPVQGMPVQGGACGGMRCRCCGCGPAADVNFRGHQGMIVIMRFLTQRGPFCRDCGLATFRQMTARTLVQGWYGYASFIITPFTVLINLLRRGKVANLPAPQPLPGVPSRAPLDPGAPLLARPSAIIGLAIPFVLFMLLIVLIVASSP